MLILHHVLRERGVQECYSGDEAVVSPPPPPIYISESLTHQRGICSPSYSIMFTRQRRRGLTRRRVKRCGEDDHGADIKPVSSPRFPPKPPYI